MNNKKTIDTKTVYYFKFIIFQDVITILQLIHMSAKILKLNMVVNSYV